MERKFLNLFICGVSFALASGWLDNGFSKRTQVDVDAFRHPAGAPVMLTLDSVRLEKATGEKFSPETEEKPKARFIILTNSALKILLSSPKLPSAYPFTIPFSESLFAISCAQCSLA